MIMRESEGLAVGPLQRGRGWRIREALLLRSGVAPGAKGF